MQNATVIIIGMVLVLVVMVQSYFIYDLRQKVDKGKPNNQEITLYTDQTPTLSDPFKDFNHSDWEPFKEIQKMQREMDRVFGNFHSHFMKNPLFKEHFKELKTSPVSDFIDRGDCYEIKMNIPGSDKNSIKIDTQNNHITISAQVEKYKEDNSSHFFKKERYVQLFYRNFDLPTDAEVDKLTKNYKNGVLSVVIPKKTK